MSRDSIKMIGLIAVIVALVTLRDKLDGPAIAQIVCLVVAGFAWLFVGESQAIAARKRDQALPAAAAELGLGFEPGENPVFFEKWSNLDALQIGTDRSIANLFRGQYSGRAIFAFDLAFTSGRNRDTHTFLMLLMDDVSFPTTRIFPKLLGAGLIPAIGIEEVQFESADFSKEYIVEADDKKFAYDVCTPAMMEFLLRYPFTNCTIEGRTIVLERVTALRPEEYKYALNELVEIRSLLPEYLFAQNA